MRKMIVAGALLLSAIGFAAEAQVPPLNFDQAAYITCREAHAMRAEPRRMLAEFLVEHSTRHRGVVVPNDVRGGELGLLVRGGCTLAPDAYLFTVIDRAVVAELAKLPKR